MWGLSNEVVPPNQAPPIPVTTLTVGDATVTATAEVTHALVPKVGSPSRTTQSARFTLAPMGSGWVIQRIETTR